MSVCLNMINHCFIFFSIIVCILLLLGRVSRIPFTCTSLERWYNRCAGHWARASGMLGKHSANWATSPELLCLLKKLKLGFLVRSRNPRYSGGWGQRGTSSKAWPKNLIRPCQKKGWERGGEGERGRKERGEEKGRKERKRKERPDENSYEE